jgi:N-dimethylarginine dimethylaminohydrolase
MKPQAYTEFQPLKQIVVGKSWNPDNIENLGNLSPKTKNLLKSLLEETEEDYQELINIIETYGAKVFRPEYGLTSNIYEYPSLMTPRDWAIVFDNDLILSNPGKDTTKWFAAGLVEHIEYFKRPKELLGFNPASIVRLGKDIIVDIQEYSNTENNYKYIRDTYKPLGYKVHGMQTNSAKFKNPMSHGDATFAILKPGVIITTKDAWRENKGLFKNWDIHIIEQEAQKNKFAAGWNKAKKIRSLEGGKIVTLANGETQQWVTNFDFENPKFDDEDFHKFIDNWLSNWVGYSIESIFDVNCLVLDESHVVFTNYNKGVFDFCKKHNIEPIICSWRHRWFWDGGLHCITVDIEREGPCEQYL